VIELQPYELALIIFGTGWVATIVGVYLGMLLSAWFRGSSHA
jgi:hypothetical protein